MSSQKSGNFRFNPYKSKKNDSKSKDMKQESISKYFSPKSSSSTSKSEKRPLEGLNDQEVENGEDGPKGPNHKNGSESKKQKLDGHESKSKSKAKGKPVTDKLKEFEAKLIEEEEPNEGGTKNYEFSREYRSNKIGGKESKNGGSDEDEGAKEKPKENLKPTPLEKQVIEMKEKHPDILMMVECGYRYRFFGTDAEIAAKVLDISCHLDRMFMTASVPTFNGPNKYVRKLTRQGYKVGIVSQTESAALKKVSGDNKSGPFSRDLTAVYTSTTVLGEEMNNLGEEKDIVDGEAVVQKMVLAITEMKLDKSETKIGMAAIEPTSGEVIWDRFVEKGFNRDELLSRIAAIQPLEIIIPDKHVSLQTKSTIAHYKEVNKSNNVIRVDTVSHSNFKKNNSLNEELLKLSSVVVECMSALFIFLKEFNLEQGLIYTKNVTKFTKTSVHMKLPYMTLKNLEVFESMDGKKSGTLFSYLNHTQTRFGGRMLRSWLSAPLMDKKEIYERLDLIKCFVSPDNSIESSLRKLLSYVPDLELALMASLTKKIRPCDFYKMCSSFQKIESAMKEIKDNEIDGEDKLKPVATIVSEIVEYLDCVKGLLKDVSKDAFTKNDKTELFHNWDKYPNVLKFKGKVSKVEEELDEHRRDIRKKLGLATFEYSSVSGMEYLIEVKNARVKDVPKDWSKISGTKQVARFRTPFVNEKLIQLNAKRDLLSIQCQEAWESFLDSFVKKFGKLQKAVKLLAKIDCLLSLTEISKQEGYCKPKFVEDEKRIKIINGRNPVVEHHLKAGSQYVANDTVLNRNGPRALLVTGPNMGGKSTYLRQVGVISIIAQIGCYVPAESATLPLIDGIFIRMGARDDLMTKKSTLMVELDEASYILGNATRNSLVLMDELGRGTSTFDGTAIAYAVLKNLVTKIKCFSIFVTHYKSLTSISEKFPGKIENGFMGYSTDANDDNDKSVLFLYKLSHGISESSFGMNVAKLAGIPEGTILESARHLSNYYEKLDMAKDNACKLFLK